MNDKNIRESKEVRYGTDEKPHLVSVLKQLLKEVENDTLKVQEIEYCFTSKSDVDSLVFFDYSVTLRGIVCNGSKFHKEFKDEKEDE